MNRISMIFVLLLTALVWIGEAKQSQKQDTSEIDFKDPVVRVKKVHQPDSPAVGQKVIYTIWGENDGGDTANCMTLVDYFDSSMVLLFGEEKYGNIFADSAAPTWGEIDILLDYLPRKVATKFINGKMPKPEPDRYFRPLTRQTDPRDVGAVRWSFIKKGYKKGMSYNGNPTLAPDNGNDDKYKIDDIVDTRPEAKADVDALYVRFSLVRIF